MSKDNYRNISFSAYIEYVFLDCTGKFAENVLRIFAHFMLIFLSPCGLCSRSLCTSLCGGEKWLFSIQSNKKSVNLGTLPVFNFDHQTPCDFFPIYLSGNMKEFIWKKIWKSEEFVWNIWRIFKEKWKAHMEKCWIWLKKWKNLCVKNLEKWRICMETWRIYL